MVALRGEGAGDPGTRADAAHEIEKELARLETRLLPIRNEAEVIEFAKVA